MIYELFLEGELADIRQDIGMQLSFNIDDINKYGSRDTSFSKTIVLPGTARNNRLLGFVGELGSFNPYASNNPNINSNFNAAQTTRAEVRANGLLLLKGVFRLTGIVKDRDIVEYEGNLFGELGGLIAEIGRSKLEDLNFSEYDHYYNWTNIVNSWFALSGSEYYYPLIDYGTYSDLKLDYDYRAFRPALYVKEYIDKIFADAGYTYQSDFFDSAFFKRLIVPNNSKELRTLSSRTLQARTSVTLFSTDNILSFDTNVFLGDFTTSDNKVYTYNGATSFKPIVNLRIFGSSFNRNWFLNHNAFGNPPNEQINIKILLKVKTSGVTTFYGLNGNNSFTSFDYIIPEQRLTYITPTFQATFVVNNAGDDYVQFPISNPMPFTPKVGSTMTVTNTALNNRTYNVTGVDTVNKRIFVRQNLFTENASPVFNYAPVNRSSSSISIPAYNSINRFIDVTISSGSEISFQVYYTPTTIPFFTIARTDLDLFSQVPISTKAVLNDRLTLNDSIPKNILQKDFFVWIVKMFNLYITEDKLREKHLLIEPYKDYYNLSDYIDWTYKVARDKPWQIKPMGMLTSRFYEYKYKEDTDFYNEGYKKKFNEPYGSILEDTRFQFAKDKQTIDIGFSPTVLVEYDGRDKIVPALYKKSTGSGVDQEERTETNIRILMTKAIQGVGVWNIVDTGANQDQAPVGLGSPIDYYGYAGHFDDPKNPTVDINFGAASEIYFDPVTYPSNNLFNTYWSGYIAEIADKDSKLLTCHVYLTDLDIAQLDFSKPVFIDGVLWRINKIIDFDASSGELTKVELLKIIDTSYPCARNWPKINYTGTKFRNGDEIPQVTNAATWAGLTTPAWCYYNNDPANEAIYGKLYNWYAINDPRGFAPDGYKVPTDDDWSGLINCLGGSSVAGGKMKSTTGWTSPNTGATNESGFNAVGAGNRGTGGSFSNIGTFGVFWTADEVGSTAAIYRQLTNTSAAITSGSISGKKAGYSVRLIKL